MNAGDTEQRKKDDHTWRLVRGQDFCKILAKVSDEVKLAVLGELMEALMYRGWDASGGGLLSAATGESHAVRHVRRIAEILEANGQGLFEYT